MDLIGRVGELGDLTERLRNRRLVTVVGPGGVGKTRLATRAAEVVGPEFEFGAVTVDLTTVDDGAGVGAALAGQLGYADLPSLLGAPSEQPTLIVVDNCEHVLDEAAHVITSVLAACRMPTVLATSRSPLELPDESVLRLGPLGVPDDAVVDEDADALRLLVERARDNGVEITSEDLAEAGEVVRRLDGVPLAIEIAAARLRSLTLTELIAELDARPHALARPRFRGRRRQRSVVDMVEWSLDLADDDLTERFEQLSVFAGPFDVAMADRVLGRASHEEAPASAVLDSLVAESLVVADTSGDAATYRMLHPVRAVGLDRLRRSGKLEVARERQADAIIDFAVATMTRSTDGWDSSVLTDLLGRYDNLVGTLRWTLTADDEPARSLLLVAVLWGVVHQAHTEEIGRLGVATLERWPDPATPGWADAAATVATVRHLLGDPSGAIELALRALPHASSPFAPATLRRVMAQAQRALGNLDESEALFGEGAAVAAERGVHGLAMELRVDQGLVRAEAGDVEGGLAIVDEVRSEAERREAAVNATWALAGRGAILARVGSDDADAALAGAVEESRSIDYPAGLLFGLRFLGARRLDRGEVVGAAASLLEALDELLARGGLNELRMVLDVAAEVLERHGDPDWETIAVTAAAFPITSIAAPVVVAAAERARAGTPVLAPREAYVRCRQALQRIAAGEAPGASDDAAPSMRREGDLWRIRFEGQSVSLRAGKGLDDLATLLAMPGREVAAVDLAGVTIVEDGMPSIDPEARRSYEEGIRSLQEDLEDADRDNDIGRSESLQADLDRLVDELTAATGLAGRTRRTGGASERARSAVTQRIRASIRRIAKHHEALGAHLDASISTGAMCCYRPERVTEWDVRP